MIQQIVHAGMRSLVRASIGRSGRHGSATPDLITEEVVHIHLGRLPDPLPFPPVFLKTVDEEFLAAAPGCIRTGRGLPGARGGAVAGPDRCRHRVQRDRQPHRLVSDAPGPFPGLAVVARDVRARHRQVPVRTATLVVRPWWATVCEW